MEYYFPVLNKAESLSVLNFSAHHTCQTDIMLLKIRSSRTFFFLIAPLQKAQQKIVPYSVRDMGDRV
ncbi:hypothetical protein AtDm6_0128 [Acetobacter tropicalis]|uniref:Uncharacterized protein n=1 Tax=Acetobacter tropicalis TaxID=104102 RepID=A0A094YYM0_9PROT|nr:hypothetical protein AtDm6_0128 [Acetobacter tropicalis]